MAQPLPENLNAAIQAANSVYEPLTTKQTFFERHPIMGAGLGLLMAGPGGAVALPASAKTKGRERRATAMEAYRSAINDAYAQENILKGLQESQNQGNVASDALINSGMASPFAPGSYVSSDAMKSALDGGTADKTYNRIRQDQQADFNNIMPGALRQIPPLPNMQPNGSPQAGQPQMMDDPSLGQPQTLAGGISQQQQLPAQPMRPFTYNNPDLLKQAITNQTELQKTALSQAPDYAKVLPEIQKLLAEGKTEEAKALLIGAQTATEKQKPALVQAQTRFENERYRGGPAPQQPTTASEGARMYAEGAFGQVGTPEARQNYVNWIRNNGESYTTDTTYTRDADGRVVSSEARRRPIAPSARPTGTKPAPTVHGIVIE